MIQERQLQAKLDSSIASVSGVAQNKAYNKNGHTFYVLFFVVTFILCNHNRLDKGQYHTHLWRQA